MIKAHALTFSYPETDEAAITNMDLEVCEGEIICLLGGNGSGKTTLLCLFAGLFSQFTGKLEVYGHVLPQDNETARKITALVPQNPDVYLLGSTLAEDLWLGLPKVAQKCDATKQRMDFLLKELGLAGLEEQPLQTLSYGQKRKACLASALISRPRLLLLDEPFAGLDFNAVLHLREIIVQNKKEGITQIITVHDLELVADIADSFALLANGSLVTSGKADLVFPVLAKNNVRPPCWWLEKKSAPAFLE